MSVLAYVRVKDEASLDFEGQVIGVAYDLFENAKSDVGEPNPFAYMVDEDELMDDDEWDEIEARYEDDEDEADDAIDEELSRRGEFWPLEEVLASLRAYHAYFAANPDTDGERTKGEYVADELEELIEVLEESGANEVRMYVG